MFGVIVLLLLSGTRAVRAEVQYVVSWSLCASSNDWRGGCYTRMMGPDACPDEETPRAQLGDATFTVRATFPTWDVRPFNDQN